MTFRTLEAVRYGMSKAETATGLGSQGELLEEVYEKGLKYAVGFRKTMKIAFDKIPPKWSYRAVPA